MNGIPADAPWWIVILLGALTGAGGFFAAQVWPYWRKAAELRLTAQLEENKANLEAARAERAEAAHERLENERERVDAWKTVAQAMDQISRTLAVMQFEISEIRRYVGIAPRMSEDKEL